MYTNNVYIYEEYADKTDITIFVIRMNLKIKCMLLVVVVVNVTTVVVWYN